MSRQTTKILYDEMKVEDGGILYDIEDLARLHGIYERLCTAEYLKENDEKIPSMKFAYEMADYIRDEVDDVCTCESEMITLWYKQAFDHACDIEGVDNDDF